MQQGERECCLSSGDLPVRGGRNDRRFPRRGARPGSDLAANSGSGMFRRPLTVSLLLRTGSAAFEQLMEARFIVETDMTALAAERRTDEDLAEMHSAGARTRRGVCWKRRPFVGSLIMVGVARSRLCPAPRRSPPSGCVP